MEMTQSTKKCNINNKKTSNKVLIAEVLYGDEKTGRIAIDKAYQKGKISLNFAKRLLKKSINADKINGNGKHLIENKMYSQYCKLATILYRANFNKIITGELDDIDNKTFKEIMTMIKFFNPSQMSTIIQYLIMTGLFKPKQLMILDKLYEVNKNLFMTVCNKTEPDIKDMIKYLIKENRLDDPKMANDFVTKINDSNWKMSPEIFKDNLKQLDIENDTAEWAYIFALRNATDKKTYNQQKALINDDYHNAVIVFESYKNGIEKLEV